MLGTFREKLVKWGAQLLFVLLLLSFVAWGIGDYIGYRGPGSNQTIAEVGGESITTFEFQQEMQDQVARMRQMFGDTFGMEQARAMGIDESVLQSMIQDALFAEGARDLGLIVDDAIVSDEIRNDPNFQTAAGDFDRAQFESALRQAGFSEGQYVALLRADILRRQYLSPIALGRDAPDALVHAIYKHRNEKRVAQIVTLPHSAIKEVPAPTDEDLAKYHEENSANYVTPEMRTLTLVRMRPEDILDEIDVSDAEIESYYQDHIAEFSTPERRTIGQILFSDEQAARAARERIAKGEDFAKIAKELDGGSLGTLAKHEVPVPELADPAFSLEAGTVSEPIQSPLGWHILRVGEVKPATRRTLEEVREEIRKRIAMDKSADALFGLAGQFEDELGGGAGAEEAANRLKLNVVKIEGVDRDGRDAAGNRHPDLTPDMLRAAFEESEGSDTPLGDLRGGGHYLIHVDKVTPSAVKPLDQVKEQVREDWTAERRAERAEAIAKEMVEEIKSGKILADVAKARGAQLSTTQPFTRTRQGLERPLPGELVAALFKSAPGTPEMAAAAEAHVIGVVSQVIPADPTAESEKEAVQSLRNEISAALAGDLSVGLAGALRERLSVSVDRAALDNAFQ